MNKGPPKHPFIRTATPQLLQSVDYRERPPGDRQGLCLGTEGSSSVIHSAFGPAPYTRSDRKRLQQGPASGRGMLWRHQKPVWARQVIPLSSVLRTAFDDVTASSEPDYPGLRIFGDHPASHPEMSERNKRLVKMETVFVRVTKRAKKLLPNRSVKAICMRVILMWTQKCYRRVNVLFLML